MSVMSCYINSNKFIFIPRSMCLLSGVSLTANESALRLLLLCEELKPSCTSGMSNVCGGGVTLSRLVSRQNSNSSGNSKHGLSIFFSFSFSTFFLLCAATGFLTGACGTVRKHLVASVVYLCAHSVHLSHQIPSLVLHTSKD